MTLEHYAKGPLVLLTLTIALGFGACAQRADLDPAPSANMVGQDGATAAVEDVRMIVRTDEWSGTPAQLTEVIPLQVTIENDSSRPLALRYGQFALVSPTGERYTALPPFSIDQTEAVPVGTTGVAGAYPFPVTGFSVAPYLGTYYPGFTPITDPFLYDEAYYGMYYPRFAQLQLPTADMVRQALPEGVLEPGGRITGFLYFPNLPDVTKVRFVAGLMAAPTGQSFGSITIPLDVER